MKLKKATLVAAMAIGLGTAGQATASIYAGSGLQIDDLTIIFLDANSGLINNINPNFTFNVEDSATLDGNTDAAAANCDSIGGTACGVAPAPVLDVRAVNGGAGAPQRLDTNYSLFGPGNGDYANANAEISTAQLVTGTPTSTKQVSEAELTSSATTGQASTNIQSNTTFTLTFSIAQPGPATMIVDFDANPEMESIVALGLFDDAGISQANMTTTLTLNHLDSNAFATWSPQGTVANDCAAIGLVCLETDDDENLNLTLGTGPLDSALSHSLGTAATDFGLTIAGLGAGDWTLTLAALTSVSVVRAVPEPGTLLLLGSGLAAFGGFSRRRRAKKQSA